MAEMIEWWKSIKPSVPQDDTTDIKQMKRKLQQLSQRLERSEACCLALCTAMLKSNTETPKELDSDVRNFLEKLLSQREIDKHEILHGFLTEANSVIDDEEERLQKQNRLDY